MIRPSLLLLLIFIFISCKDKQSTIPRDKDFAMNEDQELIAISKLVDADQLNPKLRFERAKMLHQREMYDEATEDLRVAILQDSMNADYYHLLSDVFMDNALSSRSLMTIQKAAQLFPNRIPTLLKLSETHLILQQYDEGILVINTILSKEPQNAEAYFMLGLIFREKGDITRAINALKTATEKDAKLIDAWIILGNILESKKDKDALRYYEAAINIEPTNINALHCKAYYIQNNGDINGAITIYRQINEIDPEYIDAYLNSGILYMDRDSFHQAIEQFNILSGKRPQDWRPYYYRSLSYKQLGKKREALEDINNAINLSKEKNEEAEEVKKEIEKMK